MGRRRKRCHVRQGEDEPDEGDQGRAESVGKAQPGDGEPVQGGVVDPEDVQSGEGMPACHQDRKQRGLRQQQQQRVQELAQPRPQGQAHENRQEERGRQEPVQPHGARELDTIREHLAIGELEDHEDRSGNHPGQEQPAPTLVPGLGLEMIFQGSRKSQMPRRTSQPRLQRLSQHGGDRSVLVIDHSSISLAQGFYSRQPLSGMESHASLNSPVQQLEAGHLAEAPQQPDTGVHEAHVHQSKRRSPRTGTAP